LAGAAGHGGVPSPTEKDVYALEGVPQGSLRNCGASLPASANSCIVIRRGQEPTYFTDCGGPDKNVYAAWSPDGTRLAFARGHDDPYRLAVARWSPTCAAITVHELASAPGLCSAILHNSSWPAWGPDSKWLYYSTCPAAGSQVEIARVKVRGDGSAASTELLTQGHPQLQGRTLRAYPAPGRDSLAFAAGSPGAWQLFLLDLGSPSATLQEPIDPQFLKPDSFIFSLAPEIVIGRRRLGTRDAVMLPRTHGERSRRIQPLQKRNAADLDPAIVVARVRLETWNKKSPPSCRATAQTHVIGNTAYTTAHHLSAKVGWPKDGTHAELATSACSCQLLRDITQ
jgi:WD40-like Beta Propeller Repeat